LCWNALVLGLQLGPCASHRAINETGNTLLMALCGWTVAHARSKANHQKGLCHEQQVPQPSGKWHATS